MPLFTRSFWLVLFIGWGSTLGVRAQTGTVRGRLLETGTGQPVSFANVVLLRGPDSVFVAGTQADAMGAFAVEKMGLGQYVLRATALGYRPGQRTITLTAATPDLDLGTLRLRSATTQLRDVLVTAERPVVSGGLDKQVIDMSKDLTVTGGTAIDALQNVPSVVVDQNGAVSIRGSSGVTIFIDGKPTTTTLEQIPASSIQLVEVITNPSARYDASGAGGILNIILKKEQRDGLNGQASATAGTGDKYNAALSLNYRRGRLNVFGSYDFRQDRRRTNATLDQTTSTRDTTLRLRQTRSGLSSRTTQALRLGFDYALTPEQTLTLAVQPRLNPGRETEFLDSRQVNETDGGQPVPAGTSQRTNATTGTFRTADVTLDYRRTWAERQGRELTASAVYTPLFFASDVASVIRYPLENTLATQQQRTVNRTTQGTAQLDYVHPLGEHRRFEAGLRSSVRRYDVDYRLSRQPALAFDPSNRFIYQQYVQAAHGIYADRRGKLSYQLGLRGEQTNLNGNQQATQARFAQHYFNLFPSATLAYELPHEQRVQLSYSKRIERPDAEDLNPFTDRSDQFNLTTGNPQLLPEYVHAVELGGERDFGQGRSLSINTFYRLETNTAQAFRQVLTDSLTGNQVTSITRQNLGRETSVGLELVGALPLTAFWKLNANASTFRRLIRGSAGGVAINTNSQVYTARINNVFTLSKRLDAQLAFNYRSPVNTAQGQRGPRNNVDVATRYTLFGDRATLTLRVADVFNTLRYNNTSSGPDFNTNSRYKRESRIAYLGFAYRFGSNQPGRSKDRKEADDAGGSGFE
ncbi:outer membrane beta-barrel family protein [Hymenobacter actinosclerus]|uniref:Outer membrane receptor proteins, mostly Fe transport n=1 Tax=Hymenobacter actinosclerus TaxID=82805 RepID=A0A1I0H3K7_9BACT|nr:outer membrane beta-barrel family protein [Hymenobacter actinosclerus]SET77390.1 Outer membrane receptor proteins, mostly Fe transport [Hymenobacter actinosclerus]